MKKLLAVLLFLPATVLAQSAGLERVTAGWPEPLRAQAQADLERIAKAGLPQAAGLDRLQEWESKGAEPAQAAALLDKWSEAVGEARLAVVGAGVAPSPGLLEAAAGARMAGLGSDEIARVVHGAASPDDAAGRCTALTTLAASGFGAASASQVIAAAAERGYGRTDLDTLVLSAQRLTRDGLASRAALIGQLDQAVRQGVRAHELYPAVVHALRPDRVEKPAQPESGFNHTLLRSGAKP